MNFQIISDGSCDLDPGLAEENGIQVVPFYVTFDGEHYKKEIEEVGVRVFYKEMIDHPKQFPKSSLPSVGDYEEAFLPYVREGIPVLCICITTKFSGSYNSAANAKQLILEEYPDAVITVIDSQVNTVLQGIFVLEAAKMQQAGKSYEEIIQYLEENKDSGRILFTIATIDYLRNGGRIGKLMGLAGSTLGLKPLIELKEGEIFSFGITRSREKSKKKVIEQVRTHFSKIQESPDDYSFAVGYGYDYEEAVEFRNQFLDALKEYSHVEEVPVYQIGATIAVHTGPHPIGVGFIRKALR